MVDATATDDTFKKEESETKIGDVFEEVMQFFFIISLFLTLIV